MFNDLDPRGHCSSVTSSSAPRSVIHNTGDPRGWTRHLQCHVRTFQVSLYRFKSDFVAFNRESVPLLSTGASITILIPSAFVSLSSAAVQSLPSRPRMNIIAAGPFHNLVYWTLLVLALQMGIGRHLWYIMGYDYIGHFGRVVLGTHPVRLLLWHNVCTKTAAPGLPPASLAP